MSNNWQHSYLETIQQLLIAGLVKSGAEYSDLAIYYLISNNCRLVLGSGHGWLSRQLIEATTPYCSDEQLTQLEDKLLDFYSNPAGIHTWSNKKIINKYFGYDQFTLLTGICESRQSQKTKTRIKEWQRKFLCSSPASPLRKGRTLTQVVRSPISVNAIKHMSDIQWLKAIEQYNNNDYHHYDHLKGGPHQLSRHLQEQTSREPARFAKLCLQLPENSNRSYFEAIIMGLSTINNQKVEHIEINLLSLCITYIFNLPDKPCGRWIPRLISSYGDSDLPTNLLEILLWYAKYDPNPDKDSSGMSTTQGFVEDLAFKAINSVRGTAAKAIGELIFDSELHYQFFSPHLQELCQEEINLAVRSEMAYFIIAVSNYDKNEAFILFELLIAEQPDALLATQWIESYINHAIFDNFDRIAPIIKRMLNSECDFVNRAGARQACIAGLAIEDNDELIEQCIQGDIAKRKGAVDVFINNITSDLYNQKSMDYLLYLFNDEEKEIRDEAAHCFYKLKEQELTPCCHFIDSFIKSKAIAGNTSKIIHLLEQSIDRLPDTLLILIEHFIQREGELSGDVRTSSAGDSYQLSELLLRLYSQTDSDEIKIRCLNAIDNMIGFGSGGLREELAQFDR